MPDMPKTPSENKILVALDFDNTQDLYALVDELDPKLCRLKIGKELFTSFGPEMVRSLQGKGFDIFLDLKYHDIPNTVAKAVKAAAELGVWMVNVHASGGRKMLEAAVKALEPFGESRPLLIAVTVLTSMSDDDLAELGLPKASDQVINLAKLAKDSGLDGVVCSAQEAASIKALAGENFVTVTPGIRPSWSATNDQQRIMTPQKACQSGADFLVIGRPITQAENPIEALHKIQTELSQCS